MSLTRVVLLRLVKDLCRCGLEDVELFISDESGAIRSALERQIRTLRTRLDSMGCFHDEPAVEQAVFGQLRSHKIKLTHNS